MSSAETAEPIKMQFGRQTRVGPRNHVFDGGAHWRQRRECHLCRVILYGM